MTYQLVPPHLHRNNSVERSIQTFKDHLIAGLSSADPSFPMHLWCRLIPQATTTLNLLRPSTVNSKVSAKAILNSAFNYNATPLAPTGTKVIAYKPSNKQKTWVPHGLEEWYIGNAAEHYQCHKVYITKTRAERIARMVEFFPHLLSIPTTFSVDAAMEAAKDLTAALRHPHPASLFAPISDPQLDALRQLAEIFSAHTTAPKVSSLPMTQPPGATTPRVAPQVISHPPAATAAPQPPQSFLRSGRNRSVEPTTWFGICN